MLPFLLLLTDERKALLEISNQILAFAGNAKGLFLAVLRTNPGSQVLGRGRDESALARNRHPLVLPALSDGDGLA